MAAYWPRVAGDDEVADTLNSLPKHVASTTLSTLTWNNSQLIRGDLVAEVIRLKREARRDSRFTAAGCSPSPGSGMA